MGIKSEMWSRGEHTREKNVLKSDKYKSKYLLAVEEQEQSSTDMSFQGYTSYWGVIDTYISSGIPHDLIFVYIIRWPPW